MILREWWFICVQILNLHTKWSNFAFSNRAKRWQSTCITVGTSLLIKVTRNIEFNLDGIEVWRQTWIQVLISHAILRLNFKLQCRLELPATSWSSHNIEWHNTLVFLKNEITMKHWLGIQIHRTTIDHKVGLCLSWLSKTWQRNIRNNRVWKWIVWERRLQIKATKWRPLFDSGCHFLPPHSP